MEDETNLPQSQDLQFCSHQESRAVFILNLKQKFSTLISLVILCYSFNLDNVSVLKILGLLFNNKLNWSDHFEFITVFKKFPRVCTSCAFLSHLSYVPRSIGPHF